MTRKMKASVIAVSILALCYPSLAQNCQIIAAAPPEDLVSFLEKHNAEQKWG